MNLATLTLIGGILHFVTLLASAAAPRVLDWRHELGKLDPLSRQLVWVHGAFIVLVIFGFGTVSVVLPRELVGGTNLARGVCAFIALFWGARLAVQFFVFKAKPRLRSWALKLGYNGLTAIFTYQTVVYAIAAMR